MTYSSTLPVAHSLTGEWRRFAVFLRRPRPPAKAAGFSRKTLLATARLLLLDYAVMALLMAIGGLAMLSGVEFPDNELEGIDWNLWWVALVVLAAPLYEELAFRSWLSGREAHLAAVGAFIAGFVLTTVIAGGVGLGLADPVQEMGAASGMGVAVGAVLALLALWRVPKGPPLRWFATLFPLFFWASALLFASIHLFNYTGEFSPLLLALVVPQLIAGTIFGYARVQYGLWSAILLHVLHNGTALALALLTADLMG